MDALQPVAGCLARAPAVLIGGGAGLSAAAASTIPGRSSGAPLRTISPATASATCILRAFTPSPRKKNVGPTGRGISNIRRSGAMPLYRRLLRLVEDKEYFVITTNVDAQFEKAGFAPERLFAVQGDYREMQCARACHQKVYSNVDAVQKILAATHDLTIPPALVPRCPECGGKMEMHLRVDQYFIEDKAWHRAARRYAEFLRAYGKGSIVLLEMGVGFNTPTIIRFPFEEITQANPHALLVRMNNEPAEPRLPIQSRTVNIDAPIPDVMDFCLRKRRKL